jgi:hypothetical protein
VDDFSPIGVRKLDARSRRKNNERQLSTGHRYHWQSGNVAFGDDLRARDANKDLLVELRRSDNSPWVSDLNGVDTNA